MSSFLTQLAHAPSIHEVHELIQQRFLHNIRFFYAHYPSLYDLLTHNTPMYELLVTPEGLDIIHKTTHMPLYPHDSDNKPTFWETSFHLAQNPLTHPQWNIYNNFYDFSPFPEMLPLTGNIIHALQNICKKNDHFLENDYHLPSNFLPSTTLLGLGGGLVLAFLLEHYEKIHSLIIFEPDVDLFAIGCYFIDFEELFKKVTPGSCFIFLKQIDNSEFVMNFFSQHRIANNFLRLELSLYEHPHITEVKNLIQAEHNANARGWGTYDDEVLGLINHIKTTQRTIPFLHNPSHLDYPLCIVGNGASLDENIPFLHHYRENIIIISCGTALKSLKSHGIIPDFHLETERRDHIASLLKADKDQIIPLIAASLVDESTFNLDGETFTFIRDGSSSSTLSHGGVVGFSGPVVGNAGASLGIILSQHVILCGIDVGFRHGKTLHSRKSLYAPEEKEGDMPIDAVETKANFDDDTVYTTSLFSLSKRNLEELFKKKSPTQTIYNVSHGAFIEGAIPSHWNDIPLPSTSRFDAVQQIKRSFTPLHVELTLLSSSILTQMDTYLYHLTHILAPTLTTKQEFFARLDQISRFCEKAYQETPTIAWLMNGTIGHLCMTMFIGMMRLSHNHIHTIYHQLIETMIMGLVDLREDLASQLKVCENA